MCHISGPPLQVISGRLVSTGGLAASGAGGLSVSGRWVEFTAADNITIATATDKVRACGQEGVAAV